MGTLKQFTSSIINSLLGPNKNIKVIMEDNVASSFTRCALQIFQASIQEYPFYNLIEETLLEHHNVYGCSSLTLLAMWHFWSNEFQLMLEEGYKMNFIINSSQEILKLLITSLSSISIPIDTLIDKSCKSEKHYVKEKKIVHYNEIPRNICYSSRHLSPTNYELVDQTESGNTTESHQAVDAKCSEIVRKLDHDDELEISILISECWKRQRLLTKSKAFQVDGLQVSSFNLPCSNSTIVDGLVIKSKYYASCFQNVKNTDRHRVLVVTPLNCKSIACLRLSLRAEMQGIKIINGSVTFEYIHLGFSPKLSLSVTKTSEDFAASKKEIWLKKCCELVLQLQVDALLIRESVDPVFANFLLNQSILVLPHVPWQTLKILCHATQHSPCTYILDCTEDCVLDLNITEWKPCCDASLENQVFIFYLNSKLSLQTVLLCHPSSLTLIMHEHQIWHLISRLKSVSECGQILPGSGKVEDYCYDFLIHLQEPDGIKSRTIGAIANGFMSYLKVVQKKTTGSYMLDDLPSKISAWHTALQLVFLFQKCDLNIINTVQNSSLL